MTPQKPFSYHEFDVANYLPDGWREQILHIARTEYTDKVIRASSVTSRETLDTTTLPVRTVGGRVVAQKLPWLYNLYTGQFRDFAQTLTGELVSTATDVRYAVNLNIQIGNEMRYECHVDSNPIEGLLYVTPHAAGTGGELVVSKRSIATGVEEISADSISIFPNVGKLVFFDARDHPHFVAALKSEVGERVAVTMNYYVPSCPESARPPDLNRHLGIE